MTDRRASARPKAEPDASHSDPTRPSQWYTRANGADHQTRRRHVWGLLGWWNDTVTIPNQGLGGTLRRAWLRIFGDRLRVPIWDPAKPPPPDQLHAVKWKRVNVGLEKFRAPHRALYYANLLLLWDSYQEALAEKAADALGPSANGKADLIVAD